MTDIIKSILLGIIEGITEWLPISSTGHLIIAQKLLGFAADNEAFREMFEVVIQFGAVLAVVVLYFQRLWPFCADKNRHFIKQNVINLWLKVAVGCLPAAIVGLLFDEKIDALFYNETVNAYVVAAMLILYGILFIVVERRQADKTPRIRVMKELSFATAFYIGCFQILSLIPGTSRSGVTILAAVMLGASRTVAAEYSFFMSVPVMVGASGLKLFKYIKGIAESTEVGFSSQPMEWVVLLVGTVVAFIVSVLAIKFFIDYIKRKDFSVFGYYRIVLGLVVIVFFAFIFH